MEILLWVVIFACATAVMIVGAELFLKNAELIGLQLGFSSFAIGVVIVGFGTSLPELTSSLLAVLANEPSMVIANAIGSNIANILLIGGMLAFIGRSLTIDKDLLSAELPFFVISSALFVVAVRDGAIHASEAVLLVGTLCIYFYYLFSEEYSSGIVVEAAKEEIQQERHGFLQLVHHYSVLKPYLLLIIGLAGLILGAKYVVDTIIEGATLLSIAPDVITISALALGTSLPELVVSIKSLRANKLSIAIGNIFGSNAFNILVAVGIPGLFATLPLDTVTFTVGYPVLLASSVILLVVGLARKLYRWEGLMFFMLYFFFMMKIFASCCNV